MWNIIIATSLYLIAQILVWFQSYGSISIPWIKNNQWVVYLMAIPITFMFVEGTKIGFKAFGEAWPLRFIGFAVGIVSFSVLTNVFFGEGLNTKTIVCIGLSLVILLIQMFWK